MDASAMKARSFLGFMSIRSGLVVVALLQVIVGVCLFMSFKFIRPSLVGVGYFLLATNCLSALLGLVFLILVVLTFSDVIELLPPAPKEAPAAGFRQFDIEATYKARAQAAFNRLRANPVFASVLQHVHIDEPLDITKSLHLPPLEIPKLDIPDYEHMPFVPHANQTAGESGEVSTDELPPK
ncbi:uncharacterized protein LOC113146740 [Cyclospora cayetanensis]|uniref:Uncharacterized protein LOC113146740 n=1 Tax=Cyclospora cayetanensis TaxID=88456 RepID=A0A6P6RTA0_9EIME|nr:uncharacterized protein LOC113146740 [Cyclospora cayetanensis]